MINCSLDCQSGGSVSSCAWIPDTVSQHSTLSGQRLHLDSWQCTSKAYRSQPGACPLRSGELGDQHCQRSAHQLHGHPPINLIGDCDLRPTRLRPAQSHLPIQHHPPTRGTLLNSMSSPTPSNISSPGFIHRPSSTPPGTRQSPTASLVAIPPDISPLPLDNVPAFTHGQNTSAGPSETSPRTSFSTTGSSRWSPSATSASCSSGEESSPPRPSLRTYSSYPTLRPAQSSRSASSTRRRIPFVSGGRVWCWLWSKLGFGRYRERQCDGNEWETQGLMAGGKRRETRRLDKIRKTISTRLDAIVSVLSRPSNEEPKR